MYVKKPGRLLEVPVDGLIHLVDHRANLVALPEGKFPLLAGFHDHVQPVGKDLPRVEKNHLEDVLWLYLEVIVIGMPVGCLEVYSLVGQN